MNRRQKAEVAVFAGYAGKRILVTGASGYLASNLVEALKDIECHIVRVSRKKPRSPVKSCKAQLIDIQADIRKNIWKNALKNVDFVFHFAAQTSVHAIESKPIANWRSNVLPLLRLIEMSALLGNEPSIVFAGTATEVGMPAKLPVNESHPVQPITIYDLHKWMAENYLKYYSDQGVIKGVTLRLANVYGPGPKSSSADRGVLNIMIQRGLSGDDITIYGNGDAIRDYIFVDDVIEAFLLTALKMGRTAGQPFFLGTGTGISVADAFTLVAERIRAATGRDVVVRYVPQPSPSPRIDQRNFIADTRKLWKSTGWKSRIGLKEGIDLTIEYYRRAYS